MFKKIIIFMTSLLLIINSTLSNAATIGAWTVSNPMAVGASILYDGSKGAVTSSVLITPNASQVAKVLRGGGAGFALTLAVEQLLGAVDWVMDPANNQVKYKITNTSQYLYTPAAWGNGSYFSTALEACQHSLSIIQKTRPDIGYSSVYTDDVDCFYVSPYGIDKIFVVKTNNPEAEKTLPLETVAQKVIENAESDNLDAQFAVLAAANNILSEVENDGAKAKPIEDELENNAKCPSGIVRNGSCWICDKSQFMPITRATRDAKTATRGKSCEYVTDPVIKATNAVFFRNLINARVQENACWSPPDPNHISRLIDDRNALSKCEN